jgi:hypothetical protein
MIVINSAIIGQMIRGRAATLTANNYICSEAKRSMINERVTAWCSRHDPAAGVGPAVTEWSGAA